MQNNERALIDIAEQVLMKKKDPMDIYSLFDQVADVKGYSDEQKEQYITQFYSDITISGRFIYVGNNEWDLKEHQKIELWDKDGSFYKEYTEIELPKEEKPAPTVKPKPKPEPKPKPKPEPEEEVKEAIKEAPKTDNETLKTEPLPPLEDIEQEEEYVEDELFEDVEEDEFDEEKYNEYMDVYEDRYDD